MKRVYMARNYPEAEMYCAELVALGLEAVVQGDRLAIPSTPFPTIWVPDEQADAAQQALVDLGLDDDKPVA